MLLENIINQSQKLIMGILFVLITVILALTFVHSEVQTLGTFEQGDCVSLIQNCANCTYVNISSVQYPNSSTALGQVVMTKQGSLYNYTYCNASATGKYIVNGHGDPDGILTVFSYDFDVTPNGEAPNSAKSTLYFGLFFIFLIFFVMSLVGVFKIENYWGRFAMFWVAYLLILGVSFVGWNIANDFLTSSSFISGMFRILFYFFMIALTPMFLLSVAWVFYIHLLNDDMKKLMNRGFDSGEAYERRKKRW